MKTLIFILVLETAFLYFPGGSFAEEDKLENRSVFASNCAPDITQPNGSIYRFCLPPGWNGDGLLVYAHGYVWFNKPLAIPNSHLCVGKPGQEVCIDDLANSLGYAFAVTSYPTNGLAVLPAVDDVVKLVSVFTATYSTPNTVLIAGVSEGGLVATLALERHPEVFGGGLATCGPIGSWKDQINYLVDFRVLLDYFFPGLIPTNQITVPGWLVDEWSSSNYFTSVVEPVIFDPDNTSLLTQLLDTSRTAYIPGNTGSIRTAIYDMMAYNIMTTNESIDKLEGNPFDNTNRVYSGSNNDTALNAGVRRFQADKEALISMQEYETSGVLIRPLVTLHTSRDQIVPHWHELLYLDKVLANNSSVMHVDQPVPVDNYGHCNFDVKEVLPAFFTLLSLAANL